jgi:hypothetical protein
MNDKKISKMKFFTSVSGGSLSRIIHVLNDTGVLSSEKSMFSPKKWRSLMGKGKLGRIIARGSAMGMFPLIAIAEAIFSSRQILVPVTNPFFLPHLIVAMRKFHRCQLSL